MTDVEHKTYEIVMTDGTRQRITIPATWKVSFGAIVPASAKSSALSYNGAGWGLRIWEATDKQRAVYSGVAEFHDVSIPTERMAVRKFGTEDWIADDGTWVGKKAELVERAWKPVDEIGAATPTPTADEDIPFGTPGNPATFAGMTARRNRSFTLEEDKEEAPF
jgi:hypothetical protein